VRALRLLVATLVVAAGALPALAVDTALTPATVDRAIAQGRALAAAHRGFVVAPYLLFGIDDAALTHDDAPVEAIEVGTPFEAVRYRGFLSGFERAPMTADALAAFAAQARTRVSILVYAHSGDEMDRGFLAKFGGGELECADGAHIAADLQRGPPNRDVYVNGTTPTYRWRGRLSYDFALTDALVRCDPATFTFTDDRGKSYRYALDLAAYP
jgi:hypothetical protein